MHKVKILTLACLALSFNSYASGQLRLEDLLDPTPVLDGSIPSPAQHMKLEIGERHWYNQEIIRYLDDVAELSPRMPPLGEHARSYGGRPLVSYAISTPENLSRLDEIRNKRAP